MTGRNISNYSAILGKKNNTMSDTLLYCCYRYCSNTDNQIVVIPVLVTQNYFCLFNLIELALHELKTR